MSPELEHKLIKRFPMIFADVRSTMDRTCMVWRMACGDGWYDLLYLACLGIEEEYYKTYPWYVILYHRFAYHVFPKWNKLISKQPRFVNKILKYKTWTGKEIERRVYRGFLPIPHWMKASQVKEKFGSLRFYLTSGTDNMFKYTDMAEELSQTTCETCGKPGKLITKGWFYTACEEHTKEQDKEINGEK